MFNRSSYKPILLTIVLVVSTSSAWAQGRGERRGTRDGGGGNICQLPEQIPVLLDFVGDYEKGLWVPARQLGEQLTLSEAGIQLGMAPVKVLTAKLESRLEVIFQKHQATSPKTIKLLKDSIKSIYFFGTQIGFRRAIGAEWTEGHICSANNTRAAVYYSNGFAILSIPIWNSLDLESQVGLLIHEGLRHIQLFLGHNGTDLDLQRITRDLVFSSEDLSLDGSYFFGIHHSPLYNDLKIALNAFCTEYENGTYKSITDKILTSLNFCTNPKKADVLSEIEKLYVEGQRYIFQTIGTGDAKERERALEFSKDIAWIFSAKTLTNVRRNTFNLVKSVAEFQTVFAFSFIESYFENPSGIGRKEKTEFESKIREVFRQVKAELEAI
jgi:hypothetical protein